MKKLLIWFLVFAFSSSAFANNRNVLFLNKIRTFTTKDASIAFARSQIENTKSPYRIDAIEFLREIKDTTSIDFLSQFVDDKDVNTFVVYALGDMRAFEKTELLIQLLEHPNPNVRGNAFTALVRIYPMQLPQGYVYDQAEVRMKKNVENITNWWKANKEELVNNYSREDDTDQEEKERLWNKYGKNYLFKK